MIVSDNRIHCSSVDGVCHAQVVGTCTCTIDPHLSGPDGTKPGLDL